MYSTHRLRQKSWKSVLLIVALVLCVLGLAGFGFSKAWYTNNIKPLDPTDTTTVAVTIPTGSTSQAIGELLYEKELIKNPQAFGWYVMTNRARNSLLAGTYKISPSLSVADIVKILKEGRVATDLVTILPAQRLDQIRAAFAKAGYSEAELNEAFEVKRYATHPVFSGYQLPSTLEGYLYPESYQRDASTTIEQIITQALNEQEAHLTEAVRAGFKKNGLTVYQGVILASIVEKEVSNGEDRPIVAQVFLKRIKLGIQLGSDVTYIYAAAVTGQVASPSLDSPYNTRKYAGFPPGPISNVSKSSLEAVANPSSTDWLYFVAGDDGKTYFSKTEAEHEALTAKHCKELCSL